MGALICRYAGASTVIDATALEGREYLPRENAYADLQCPGARRLPVETADRLWTFPELTDARRVVVLVPAAVEAAHPGQPRGYRLVRRTVDRSIRRPVEVPISVLEFERTP